MSFRKLIKITYGLYCQDQHNQGQHSKQESFATDPEDDGEEQSPAVVPDLLFSVNRYFLFPICKN